MKVTDLYIKIANGEIKDKTKFRIHWGNMYRDFYYDGSEKNQLQCLKNCSDDYPLYDDINLNDEVEIIENASKKIDLDHFKSIKELKETVDNWIENDELYWERWFSLYDLRKLVNMINEE